ncbi:MAG: glycerol kinase GlpK [Clostridia bacterium]|nr:glycerol kinase GlpK [Clostridia bacterium]
MSYIIALDQGTTSSRALVVNPDGTIRSIHAVEFPQYYPQPGWVEHDAMEILSSQLTALKEAIRQGGIALEEIAGIGITNQRETTILWDKYTGKPIAHAIVWQCRRTAQMIEDLKTEGYARVLTEKTGLIPDAYFSATKIKWLLDHVEGARNKANRGEILFGTVETWLIWNLTGGKVHVTDATNASRTMLYNLRTGTWDDEILAHLGIPKAILPRIVDSSGVVGYTEESVTGFHAPIASLIGDQHAALFGQACFVPGMAKNTYGTGCFLLMNTGTTPVVSRNQLLTTVAWQIDGKREFALEGSVFVAGAAVQWLRDEMKMIKTAAETEEIALSIKNTGGVYLVPAFTGLGAPYWDMYGRGILVGLTRGTGRAEVVRATLESIALQTMDVMRAMEQDAGVLLSQLRVDGGASANRFLMQFQSDILGTSVIRPRITETTAIGAAYLAGLAVGFWESKEELEQLWQSENTFQPSIPAEERQQIAKQWHRAVERAKGWAES